MSTDVQFPAEKQRTWEKIVRLIDKELEAESEAYIEQIKTVMASTLQENDELFIEDLPYLLPLVKNDESDSLQNYADLEAVKKVRKLVDILAPKIKTVMHA